MHYIPASCALLFLLLIGCESALDIDTERIETHSPTAETDPVLKISDFSVTTSVTGFTPQAPADWNYTAIAENFSMDFASSPPTFSLDYQLARPAGSPAAQFVLENLRLRLENLTADGATSIGGFPGTGPGILLDGNFTVGSPPSITYTTDPSETGYTPYSATGTFVYTPGPGATLEGEIVVTMQLPQNTRPTFTIAFTAEEQ